MRLQKEAFDPDFVALYMNSAPARAFFLSRAKRTTNLASINSSDVAEFPCPAPPIADQRRLVREVGDRLAESQNLRREAREMIANALEQAEARLVEDRP